jgi:Flp pilus assembly protein TadG
MNRALTKFVSRGRRRRMLSSSALLRGESGSSAVEMAISLPIMLCVLFAIMEFGYALYTYNVVAESAREGSRWASVRGSACTGGYECNANFFQIRQYVQNLGYPGVNPAQMHVRTEWCPVGGPCFFSFFPANYPGNTVKVTVTYPFTLSIPFVPQELWTFSSTSQMVISQ